MLSVLALEDLLQSIVATNVLMQMGPMCQAQAGAGRHMASGALGKALCPSMQATPTQAVSQQQPTQVLLHHSTVWESRVSWSSDFSRSKALYAGFRVRS